MKSRNGQSEGPALLGLAERAGALAKGTDAARRALRRGDACLVLLAEDGSEVQRQKLVPLAQRRGVPVRTLGSRAELGAVLGRGPLAAVVVTRPRFAEELETRIGKG
jgi:ribosomal protein L7Ae-like RNA K-turn-binding protein